VYEGIHQPVAHLFLWQGVGRFGVQDGKARKDQVAVEGELFLDAAAGNDRAVVHFAAGGGQGEHGAEGQGFRGLREAVAGEDFPGVFSGVEGSQRDEFDAVDDRTAAGCQQKIDALFADFFDSLHQRVVIRVGFDAAEFQHLALFERGHHLVVDAVLFDGAAAVKDHDFGFAGNEFVEFGDGAGAKNDFGGVVEAKVVNHDASSWMGLGVMITGQKREPFAGLYPRQGDFGFWAGEPFALCHALTNMIRKDPSLKLRMTK